MPEKSADEQSILQPSMRKSPTRDHKAKAPPSGSGMFKQIQAVVRRIPSGHVATYGQVARAAGFPGAARQVVWALHAATTVPWHRVVGAGGRVLLGGAGGTEQRRRLRKEGVTFSGGKVAMDRHQVPWERT